MLASLFCLDLRSQENPQGSLSTADLYRHLINVRTWAFHNDDPCTAWRRRACAQEAAAILINSTRKMVESVAFESGQKGLTGWLFKSPRPNKAKAGSLAWYCRHIAKGLMATGKTESEVADTCWLTALEGVGVPVKVVSGRYLLVIHSQADFGCLVH